MPIAHQRFANPLRFRISDSKPRSASASAPDTPRRTIHRQTRNKTPAKCLDRAGKFPEMDDLEPLPVECTVLRQLPHLQNINIPVVSIIWNYNGLPPQQMADRIVSGNERSLTTTVDNIEHIESESLYGIAVIKVFFQPTASVDMAIAQITAICQTQLRRLPAGTTPPLIITYSASTVPILQLALSGQNLSEQQLYDYALNSIRTQLITVPGASVPFPYGGKQRQVQVDLNPAALESKGLSALDVINAISAQKLILPTGTSKIGGKEYDVDIPNAAPQTIDELNRIPVKTVGNTTIYIKDVAWVRDGFPPQTIVRVDGQRSVLLTIEKAGTASTLAIISGIKSLLPYIKTTVPPQLNIDPVADQSVFVLGAINGVVREMLIAACLTALMILLFLGSWWSAHHRNIHSVGDSDLHHCVQRVGADDQYHDPGRTGVSRRHPGERPWKSRTSTETEV